MSRLSICLDSKHEGSRLPPIILNLEQELLDGTISRSMAIQSLRIYATHADPHEMLAVNDLLQRLEKRSPSN